MPGHPRVSATALLCGLASWALWWTRLGPGVAGSSVVLKHQACWWVELCPCLASCLAWGIPVLVPKGYWVGPGPSTNKLKNPKSCLVSLWLNKLPKRLPPTLMSPWWAQLPLNLSRRLSKAASSSDPGSFQMTALTLSPRAYEILCALLRVEFLSHSNLAVLKVSPAGLQSQMFWGACLLSAGESNIGLRWLAHWREPLQLIILWSVGLSPWGYRS